MSEVYKGPSVPYVSEIAQDRLKDYLDRAVAMDFGGVPEVSKGSVVEDKFRSGLNPTQAVLLEMIENQERAIAALNHDVGVAQANAFAANELAAKLEARIEELAEKVEWLMDGEFVESD